jgi:hypothetical protein
MLKNDEIERLKAVVEGLGGGGTDIGSSGPPPPW